MKHARDRKESLGGGLFLERIPPEVYRTLVERLEEYGFRNGPERGGKMRLAEYYVGLRAAAAKTFREFVESVILRARRGLFPQAELPDGFASVPSTLLPLEREGGFSFGYFDAAVTERGLRIIELQAFPTYALVSAELALALEAGLGASPSQIEEREAEFREFLELKREIVAGGEREGSVILERDLARQKTNFSLYAIRRRLAANLEVVDARSLFMRGDRLFRRDRGAEIPVRRIYNRVVPFEAMLEDGYPENPEIWGFRFDRPLDAIFVNHPERFFSVSKRLLPCIDHPMNPPCRELAEAAAEFRSGEARFGDYVWKHKFGYAGRHNILNPSREDLEDLARRGSLGDYVSQRRIDYEIFRTGDGLEKIVELRFMTVQSSERLAIVPMARLGRAERSASGEIVFRTHFGDNNRPGYGYAPVIAAES